MEPSGVKFVVPLGTYSFARLPATRSWRRGSHSNPFPVLRARNLLILRVALVAGTALTAVVAVSVQTDPYGCGVRTSVGIPGYGHYRHTIIGVRPRLVYYAFSRVQRSSPSVTERSFFWFTRYMLSRVTSPGLF